MNRLKNVLISRKDARKVILSNKVILCKCLSFSFFKMIGRDYYIGRRDYYIGSPDIYSSITDDVWHIIMLYEGYPFQTYRGYKFSYRIKGNEIFVNRKDTSKSITRSSVDIAVKEALELRAQGVKDYGSKKLKVFGASYIWGIFHVIGLC